MIHHLKRNPITIWFYTLASAIYYELKYHKKKLKIGNMTYVSNSKFGNFNRLYDNIKLKNVKLGDYSYVAADTQIKNAKIGKFCSIAPGCRIGLGKHPTKDFVSTHPIFFSLNKQISTVFANKNYFKEEEQITIGNDVWIGTNVIIVDGVIISDGAIIAAGAVVTKNVPPYAIVGGVPAKIIKYRFEENHIRQLIDAKWWNTSIEQLGREYTKFHNIQDFLADFD